MGPSVSVTLDKERYLRFGYRNSRLAVGALQNAMPARAEKLSIGDAAYLVAKPDQDAVLIFLYRGLNHEDRETVKLEQVERWLEKAMDDKRDLSEITFPILEALKQAGLIAINYKVNLPKDEGNGNAEIGAFIDPLSSRPGPLATTSHDQSSRE